MHSSTWRGTSRRSAALAAAEAVGVAGAVALSAEVVMLDTPVVAADAPVGPDDAGTVGIDDTVEPPPDTDVPVGVMALVLSIAGAAFY